MKKNNAISLIITLLNEAKSISSLLESIDNQTIPPDEIIFVDAGSTDQTVALLKDYQTKTEVKVRILEMPNCNRSVGRNYGIRQAKNQLIAVTDAGNILHKKWLERITLPLIENQADSVAGYYLPLADTPFQQAVAPFVAVMPKKFDPTNFLPSSRSVAFTKKAWELAGRYPEHLNYCEDLVFAMHLKRNTKMIVQSKAIVYWPQKKTFYGFFRQISNYAYGDVLAGYQPHLYKISTVFGRYIIFLLVPPAILIYLIWSIYKMRQQLTNLTAFMYVPALQLTADVAVMVGALRGFISPNPDQKTTYTPALEVET